VILEKLTKFTLSKEVRTEGSGSGLMQMMLEEQLKLKKHWTISSLTIGK